MYVFSFKRLQKQLSMRTHKSRCSDYLILNERHIVKQYITGLLV